MTASEGNRMGSQVQRLAYNALALVTGGVVAQLVFTLVEVLIARKLGADSYGVFVTAYSWTVLASTIMGHGMALWTVQEGSRNHDRIPALLGSSLVAGAAIFAVMYAALVAAVYWLEPNPVLAFLLVLLPYGLVLATQTNLGAAYSCCQTMQINAWFQALAPLAILVFCFAWARGELALEDVGRAYVVGGGIVTAAWLALAFRRFRPTFSARHALETAWSSNQYALTNLLGNVFYRTDVVMLSALAGVREAGIYAAAYKLVELVLKFAVVAGRVFAPALFKASHEPGKAYLVFASMMTRFLAVAGLAAGVASFILAEELIRLLFGEGYAASVPVLRILGGVMATRGMMVALQLLLSSVDLHFRRVASLGVTVVANIVANAVLIPLLGAQGAAWAGLFSGALLIVLYAVSCAGRQDFRFVQWLLVPSVMAIAIATAAPLLGMNAFVTAVLSLSVLAAGLLLTGFVRGDEIRFVLRSLLPAGTAR